MKRLSLGLSLMVPLLWITACTSESGPSVSNGIQNDRQLKSLSSSEAFYDALRDGLKYQFSPGVDHASTIGAVSEPDVLPVAAPSESTSDTAAEFSSTNSGGNDVTQTNVQEVGVDEQDWVKVSANGQHLYVLNTQSSYDYPFPLPVIEPDLIDPASTSVASDSIAFPENVSTRLRVMELDAETPDSQELLGLTIDLGSESAEGFYLYETDAQDSLFITSSGSNFWSYWSSPTAFSGLSSTITQVDVSNPSQASVTRSLNLDGQLIASRRIGQYLVFASRYFPTLPGDQPWQQDQASWHAQVDAADLSAVLPQYQLSDSDQTTSLVDPANCFVSPAADDSLGYSPDIITLGVFDLESFTLSDSQCYLGSSETLYASRNAIYLATTRYDYSQGPVAEDGSRVDTSDGEFPQDIIWYDPRVDTDIHQFTIAEGQLAYAGSGVVQGHLGWNPLRKPFRMSEDSGLLRVFTVNDEQGQGKSPVLLTVLQADGAGNLQQVSTLPNDNHPAFIGKPGEQLYASRFRGDRAYIVTFRQTDPLYVIDLSNPQDPRVAGELEIEGYSDYLQPIDDRYLLGIGKDAIAATGGFGDGRGAWVQGVKLALFDVQDPSQPFEVEAMVIGQRGSHADALTDHRAITVQAASDAHPLRISFGISVAGEVIAERAADESSARQYFPWSYTGLHGFDINVGDVPSIVYRGALVVESAERVNNTFYQGAVQNRSVMVNDSVFYVYADSVYAAHWNDMANPSSAR